MNEIKGATQGDPAFAAPGPVPEGDAQAMRRGLAQGAALLDVARRRLAAWAEENPGELLLVGVGLGFVLGKSLFRRRPDDLRELS